MFIGHFAVGLGAKKFASKLSLGTLFLATLLPDLLFPLFLIAGIEKMRIDPQVTGFVSIDLVYYPFSHGLLGCTIQAVSVAAIYYLVRKTVLPSLLLGSLVILHFALDFISHRPDLQLVWWNEFRIGLGLWNSVALTLLVEILLFILGSVLYIRATRARNKKGNIALVALFVFSGTLYLLSAFGPPPPGEVEFAVAGLLSWLFVGWGYLIDKNRKEIAATKGDEITGATSLVP